MRKAWVTILLSGAAACSGGGEESRQASQDLKTFEASEDSSGAPRPPGVAPTAAPGVAFNYQYSFRLAGERIAAMQEQHAAACEKLGIHRCRITGMRYQLVGHDEIRGMLAFKLDPAIARGFGRQGIDVVNRAEGMLVDAQITGEDVGTQIAAANRNEGELSDELKKIEAQLAAPGRGGTERAELQNRAQQLRDQMRASRATKAEQQQSLATTPMVFNYDSGDLVPGLDGRPRLKQAFQHAADNFLGGLLWILVAAITLLPWFVAAGLAFWAWRRWWPRLSAHRPATPAAPSEG